MGTLGVQETLKTRIRITGELTLGQEITLEEEATHHLMSVLRARVGDAVGLVDGAGKLYRSVLQSLNPCVVQVEEELVTGVVNAARRVVVWVPLLKSKKTDTLIRQLTELGVAEVVVYLSERSVIRPNRDAVEKLLGRYRRISEEATRQCRRTDTVTLRLSSALPSEEGGIFLWEREGESVELLWTDESPIRRVLIGPEGGLSQSEGEALQARGWRAVFLGDRILRAETAVMAAVSLAIYR